nr:GDP-mannose 4,6-dehydratase [Methylomarinum sp. Ch1-1]MDP4519222.1 GDP-mannose 4,6-dehydratase [Methylomarinum sp. Ch1-1]
MTSLHGDIRDLSLVKKTVSAINPDILIHMAAQSLVRYGYHHPVETYQTNVMGTLHVLEAIRACQGVRAAVMVTTDKCYESMEAGEPHRENDPLGGHDPYSSSKGCAELLIASYRHSFFRVHECSHRQCQGWKCYRRRRLGRTSPGAGRD